MTISAPTTRFGLTREEVLAHIAKFPEGLRFGEIQRFIVEWHGLDYDQKRFTIWNGRYISQRVHRGWWCDNLITGKGPYRFREGILTKYCTKVGNRYIVK